MKVKLSAGYSEGTSPKAAAARTKAPDLLISDITMPGISGIELAIKVKELYPKCKILLFSGHPASLALLEDARTQGHDFCLLLKPVPPGEFLSEIRRMVEGAVPIPPRSTTLRPQHGSSGTSKPRAQSDQL